MPQDRTLLAANTRLRVERVRSHAVAPQWSPVYQAPTRRLVIPGSGTVHFRADGQRMLADSLSAFSVDAQAYYQLRPEGDEGRSSVVVSDCVAITAAGVPGSRGWMLAPRALYNLRRHWRALERGDDTVDATAAAVNNALRSALPVQAGRTESQGVVRARSLLLAQPGGNATLHNIADAACCSPFHLARSFRRHTGLSLHQYRQQLRLVAAMTRLEDGERDLAGLAHDLGFCSQSHLGAVFGREVGATLSQARAALAR